MPRIRRAIPQAQEPSIGARINFLVDAHLPPSLCAPLQAAGHDALHTRQLTAQNQTPDNILNELSLREHRVVATKDSDFYHSHLLQGKPWKLLLVSTGNIRTRDLKALFQTHLSAIISALEQNSLVELDRHKVQIIL
jgi:predicted nuclease of predicted toxin-antitoxin system